MEEMHTATYREGAWSFYALGEHCSPHISMCSPTQNYRLLGLLDCPGSLKSKAQFLKNQIKKNKEREHTHTHTHTPQKQKLNYSLQDSGSIRIFLLEEDIFILGLKRMTSIQTQLGTRGPNLSCGSTRQKQTIDTVWQRLQILDLPYSACKTITLTGRKSILNMPAKNKKGQ